MQSIVYEHFQHLHLIKKYQQFPINWLATTFYINYNIACAHISYKALAIKKKKIQRMLEILPIIKILKIRHLNIFQ